MPWSTRWTLALTPFPVHHPLYRAHSSEAQYGMYRVSVLMAHQHTISPFSLVRPKNYYTNPHHGDSNIWEGTTGGRPTSCKKCASKRNFTWLSTGWLMATLVCRCKTPATGRNWRGRGCWERDDRLCHGQADARASNDVGRGASYFKRETWGGRRADPAGTSVRILSIAAPSQLFVNQKYEHLFKANAAAEAPPTNAPGGAAIARHSHYLQSKVVRARERIEAELDMAREEEPPATAG
jgi:Pam16